MPDSIYTEEQKPEQAPLLIGVVDAAKLLSMGQTWLREKVVANEIPYLRLGNRVMFDPEELKRWIKSKMLNSVQASTQAAQ